MRIKQAAARGTGLLASTAILGLCVTGCVQTYRAPALPANQLARVKFDSITRDMKVDGLPLPPAHDGKPPSETLVGVGCRVLTVKYEASYFVCGDKKADRAGLGTGLAATLANTEQHDYETMRLIRFSSRRGLAASTGLPQRSPAMSFCRASSRAMRAAIQCASSCPTSPAKARRAHRRQRRCLRQEAPPTSRPPIRPNKLAASRGDFKQAAFLEKELWQHFGAEERALEALRMLVSLAARSSRSVA